MSPKVIELKEENKDGAKIIRRTLDEILGKVEQELVITKDKITRRTWFARHYNEIVLKRIKTKDGKEALDVVWGHQGEGRSDWYWCTIVPPDQRQIDLLFSAIKDHETYGKIISRLHDQCLSKNVNKRVECDLSFLLE
jgi:hypothetical protein